MADQDVRPVEPQPIAQDIAPVHPDEFRTLREPIAGLPSPPAPLPPNPISAKKPDRLTLWLRRHPLAWTSRHPTAWRRMRRWCGLVLVGSGLVMALCCVGEGLAATRTYVDLWRNGLPAAAIIVGEVAGPDLALGGLMIGSALAVLGIVLRASSRRVDGEMPHVAWIGGTGLGGFLSWLSIGWAARRLGRPALVRWSIGYGVAMVAAVGLLAGSLLLGELGPPGLALWAIVWVSSMVHGWMLVPAMAGTSHDGSGGPAQYSPLMTK